MHRMLCVLSIRGKVYYTWVLVELIPATYGHVWLALFSVHAIAHIHISRVHMCGSGSIRIIPRRCNTFPEILPPRSFTHISSITNFVILLRFVLRYVLWFTRRACHAVRVVIISHQYKHLRGKLHATRIHAYEKISHANTSTYTFPLYTLYNVKYAKQQNIR